MSARLAPTRLQELMAQAGIADVALTDVALFAVGWFARADSTEMLACLNSYREHVLERTENRL